VPPPVAAPIPPLAAGWSAWGLESGSARATSCLSSTTADSTSKAAREDRTNARPEPRMGCPADADGDLCVASIVDPLEPCAHTSETNPHHPRGTAIDHVADVTYISSLSRSRCKCDGTLLEFHSTRFCRGEQVRSGRGRAIAFGGAECFRRTCQPTSLPLDHQIRRLGLPEVWIWRSRPSGWAKCDCPRARGQGTQTAAEEPTRGTLGPGVNC